MLGDSDGSLYFFSNQRVVEHTSQCISTGQSGIVLFSYSDRDSRFPLFLAEVEKSTQVEYYYF